MPCLIVPVEYGCKSPGPPVPRQTRLAVQQNPIAGASRHAPRGRGRAHRNRCSSVTSGGLQKLLELGTKPDRHGLVLRRLGYLLKALGLILWQADLNHAGVACSGVFRRSSCHQPLGIGITIAEAQSRFRSSNALFSVIAVPRKCG